MKKYVCNLCGSEEVSEKLWRNVNGGPVFTSSEYWCEDCENYVGLREVED